MVVVFILKFEKGPPTLAPKTEEPLDAMSMLVFLGALVGALVGACMGANAVSILDLRHVPRGHNEAHSS